MRSADHYGLGNPKSVICRLINSSMFAVEMRVERIRDSSKGCFLVVDPPKLLKRLKRYEIFIPFIDGIGGRKILDHSLCKLNKGIALEILDLRY